RQAVLEQFLGTNGERIPYIISIAGSVAVGKSTTARVLQALLSRWPEHRKVELITTDGFLHPNQVLKERGLMKKKGFPQSYDMHRLVKFVSDLKSGVPNVTAPVYSHLIYDVIPDGDKTVAQPDILILEGLNVLQSGTDYPHDPHHVFVSDFVDFSIYVDAPEELLQTWYINRFLKFREGAFTNPDSYFHNYAKLSEDEAINTATSLWKEINWLNLKQNILPTRERASLIMTKSANHAVEQEGLVPYLSRWKALDNFINRPVKLIIGDKEIFGISRGIDAQGALLLEQNGEIKPWMGGEISLRSAE
ncbi:type I pantothenate kinase, partial [Citrobacter youngae]|uniref:type I pantothenate kinase n=1 Tax=Citrobacter youngae TaxID=133448 RepID=UPI003EE30A9B